MVAIEVLAWIFAAAILLKLVAGLAKPEDWLKMAETIAQRRALATLVYLVLAIIVGALVLTNLSAGQIGAVMLFTALLMGITFMPYYKGMVQAAKETMQTRSQMLCKNWLGLLVWAALAIWLVYKLLAADGS